MKVLLNYDYPGNVRELENILEHALILSRGSAIDMDHLPDYVRTLPISGPHMPTDDPWKEELPPSPEARRIIETLAKHHGHRGKTARALNIDRSTLWRKMKQYGVD